MNTSSAEPTQFADVVRNTAQAVGLLEPDGTLSQADSLAILDLVTNLEETTQMTIPTNAITPEHFRTIESIAGLLASMSTGGQ